MKRMMTLAAALILAMGAAAQGDNVGMGGPDGNYASLAERIANIEKKNDAFNVYFNYAASAQAIYDGHTWNSKLANKQLRLEIKGNITPQFFYRLRHRMNKANTAQGEDNFAKATDIMMVGYNINDKLTVMGGKMCQIWGGHEFDENPMYIYQYSDMVDNMDNFMAGVVVAYHPVPSQEIAVEVSDANNGKFSDEYGAGAVAVTGRGDGIRQLKKSNNPLTYIVNWNGNFFGGRFQTRWSWGLQTQARHEYSRMWIFGQKLNLSTVQWYVDYMGAWDGLDRLRIATNDLGTFLNGRENAYFSDVHYNSLISKVNWQFVPRWNFVAKGTYETASVSKIEQLKDYRKSIGYLASLEYYPVKDQDLRLFLAYVGHHYDFSRKCGLEDYSTSRIELGFMYRIKCF